MPAEARAAITAVVDRVRAAVEGSARAGGEPRPVRWVRMDGLHVTVRFLGPTPADRVPGVERAIADAAATSVPFRLRIHGGGGFPRPDRPRSLWLRITEGSDELAALAGRLDDRLAEHEWPRESRPFRAHLTLARSDGVRAGPETLRRLVEEAESLDVSWAAGELVLFESVTGGGPARYEPLYRAPFGVAAAGERQ